MSFRAQSGASCRLPNFAGGMPPLEFSAELSRVTVPLTFVPYSPDCGRVSSVPSSGQVSLLNSEAFVQHE